MLEAVPLLATTFLFISIFLYIFASVQLHDIRANWNERRCELLVMIIAQQVADPEDLNYDDFAYDNFSFCINKLISSTMSIALGPVFSIFSKQLEVIHPIHAAVNSLKYSASNIVTNPFNSYMNILWKKLKYVVYSVAKIFIHMTSSFHRIYGVLLSTIFAGMAMYKSIMNAKNFLIKICVIILYIIIALLFLLFIPLFQVIPIIIIPLISALAVAGVAVGGMEDSFNCVAPGTLVACKDGWRAVESLKVGDPLREGHVTGILQGIPGGACVSIGEVVISSLHLVFDKEVGKWVHASEHSLAIPHEAPATVYCLTTTTGTWVVEGELLLRDWTDIPKTEEAGERMEEFVWNTLNPDDVDLEDDYVVEYKGTTILSGYTQILTKEGYVKMMDLKIGNYVYDGDSFTEVVGVYSGRGSGEKAGEPDAAWILNRTRNRWVHPILKSDIPDHGYNIITRSGKYSIHGVIRRDLTEIGCNRLYETRRIVLSLLNNRNDEEECILT